MGYPLDEVDLKHFYSRKLSRFVIVILWVGVGWVVVLLVCLLVSYWFPIVSYWFLIGFLLAPYCFPTGFLLVPTGSLLLSYWFPISFLLLMAQESPRKP